MKRHPELAHRWLFRRLVAEGLPAVVAGGVRRIAENYEFVRTMRGMAFGQELALAAEFQQSVQTETETDNLAVQFKAGNPTANGFRPVPKIYT